MDENIIQPTENIKNKPIINMEQKIEDMEEKPIEDKQEVIQKVDNMEEKPIEDKLMPMKSLLAKWHESGPSLIKIKDFKSHTQILKGNFPFNELLNDAAKAP